MGMWPNLASKLWLHQNSPHLHESTQETLWDMEAAQPEDCRITFFRPLLWLRRSYDNRGCRALKRPPILLPIPCPVRVLLVAANEVIHLRGLTVGFLGKKSQQNSEAQAQLPKGFSVCGAILVHPGGTCLMQGPVVTCFSHQRCAQFFFICQLSKMSAHWTLNPPVCQAPVAAMKTWRHTIEGEHQKKELQKQPSFLTQKKDPDPKIQNLSVAPGSCQFHLWWHASNLPGSPPFASPRIRNVRSPASRPPPRAKAPCPEKIGQTWPPKTNKRVWWAKAIIDSDSSFKNLSSSLGILSWMSVAVLLISLISSHSNAHVCFEAMFELQSEPLISAHSARISSTTGLHGHESRIDFLRQTSPAMVSSNMLVPPWQSSWSSWFQHWGEVRRPMVTSMQKSKPHQGRVKSWSKLRRVRFDGDDSRILSICEPLTDWWEALESPAGRRTHRPGVTTVATNKLDPMRSCWPVLKRAVVVKARTAEIEFHIFILGADVSEEYEETHEFHDMKERYIDTCWSSKRVCWVLDKKKITHVLFQIGGKHTPG